MDELWEKLHYCVYRENSTGYLVFLNGLSMKSGNLYYQVQNVIFRHDKSLVDYIAAKFDEEFEQVFMARTSSPLRLGDVRIDFEQGRAGEKLKVCGWEMSNIHNGDYDKGLSDVFNGTFG